MRKLIVYPNCSKGGVTSVIRGRARNEPATQFDVVFWNDRGGRHAFDDLENVAVRIVTNGRLRPYLQYVVKAFNYDAVHVLSSPEVANLLSSHDDLALTYEFHSSNMKVVENELTELDLDRLAEIHVPSPQMAEWISERVRRRIRSRISVVPNLVDSGIFSPVGSADFLSSQADPDGNSTIPLVWVGRFDRDKGYQYFVRLLAQLPDHYVGVVVVSLEHDPHRISKFFAECDALGVRKRIQLFMDLPQVVMADLYRSAAKANGSLISTSLMESFGYAVAEAASCQLSVVAFDLPVWDLVQDQGTIKRIPPGDVLAMADAMAEQN